MTTVFVTIFVRHAAECKYAGDEFAKRCACRKHLRWTSEGKQHRRAAGTRSWTEAEAKKRNIEDQLAGHVAEAETAKLLDLAAAVDVFIQDKRVQGVSDGVLGKYVRELARLKDFAAKKEVFTVQGVSRELLTGYCGTFAKAYPSTQTRGMVRARTRSFLRYCYEAQWLERIPTLPKITVDEAPTLPLTPEEYAGLLKAASSLPDLDKAARCRALFQLMRYSGLSVRDALTLRRSAVQFDTARKLHRVTTSRQKTGTHVSVPLPPAVGEELAKVPNANADYVFWDGKKDIVKTWTKYFIAPTFLAAKIEKGGNMMSHRLRDTFAVDLLERGVPMEEVSRLLGHTSIKTTEKSYARWSRGRQDRTDALVTGAWSK